MDCVQLYTEMGQTMVDCDQCDTIVSSTLSVVSTQQVTIAMECDQCDTIVSSSLIVVSTHAGHHSNVV